MNTPQRVTMHVHDVRGRIVRRVFEGSLGAGEHELRFDGRNDRGAPLPSGVYFARVTTNAGQAVRKITLLK